MAVWWRAIQWLRLPTPAGKERLPGTPAAAALRQAACGFTARLKMCPFEAWLGRVGGWHPHSHPTHDDETVMNGAPKMPTLATMRPSRRWGT